MTETTKRPLATGGYVTDVRVHVPTGCVIRVPDEGPVTIKDPMQNQRALSRNFHVHDQHGVCVKNRFAPRCDPPEPRDKVQEALDFVKEHLDLDLQPWQEVFLRAAIEGKHTFEHRVRNVNSTRYETGTYGFFGSAVKWVEAQSRPDDYEILSRPAFPFRSLA